MKCINSGCSAPLVRCFYLLHQKTCSHRLAGSNELPAKLSRKSSTKAERRRAREERRRAKAAKAAAAKEKRSQKKKKKSSKSRKSEASEQPPDSKSSEAKSQSPSSKSSNSRSKSEAKTSTPKKTEPTSTTTTTTTTTTNNNNNNKSPKADETNDATGSSEPQRDLTAAEARLAAMSQSNGIREDAHHKALRRAAFDGDLPTLKKLLADPQTSVDSRDKSGMTLLISASVNGRLAAVRALLKAGADVSLVSSMGNGVLHYLAKWQPHAEESHANETDANFRYSLPPNFVVFWKIFFFLIYI